MQDLTNSASSRKAVERLYNSKAQMNSVCMQLRSNLGVFLQIFFRCIMNSFSSMNAL